MKNKSVVKRKILPVVIGLLLLISYMLGNIEMGKLGSKMDYVNLLSQGDRKRYDLFIGRKRAPEKSTVR